MLIESYRWALHLFCIIWRQPKSMQSAAKIEQLLEDIAEVGLLQDRTTIIHNKHGKTKDQGMLFTDMTNKIKNW